MAYHLSLTVDDMLNRVVKLHGNNVALFYENRSVTYEQLQERVEYLAAALLERGAKKGERFFIYGKNSQQMVETFLACAKIGLIAVPVNTRLTEVEISHIVKEIEPAFLFIDAEISEQCFRDIHVKAKIVVDRRHDSEAICYESLIDEKLPLSTKTIEISSEEPYLIIYTAAVDGYPKGAVLTHRNVIACNVVTKELLELGIDDVCGIFTPLYHIAGTSLLFSGLHQGLPNFLLPEFNPAVAVEKISEKNISICCLFSPMGNLLLSAADEKEIEIGKSLRAAFGLDSPDTIDVYLKKGIDWYGIYAQTEVTGVISAKKYAYGSDVGLIGEPSLLIDISLQNDDGEEVGVGEVGEICVRGETVFSHYWNREKDNDWIFRGGWHHTGDQAMKDEKGRMWFKGRKSEKELIKSGGENVYPAEVEQALKRHDAVEEAVVFGVPDKKWLEAVKAVVVLKEDKQLTEEQLLTFCREKLSAYKLPKSIEFVTTLPEKDGQIDREAVKNEYQKNN